MSRLVIPIITQSPNCFEPGQRERFVGDPKSRI